MPGAIAQLASPAHATTSTASRPHSAAPLRGTSQTASICLPSSLHTQSPDKQTHHVPGPPSHTRQHCAQSGLRSTTPRPSSVSASRKHTNPSPGFPANIRTVFANSHLIFRNVDGYADDAPITFLPKMQPGGTLRDNVGPSGDVRRFPGRFPSGQKPQKPPGTPPAGRATALSGLCLPGSKRTTHTPPVSRLTETALRAVRAPFQEAFCRKNACSHQKTV